MIAYMIRALSLISFKIKKVGHSSSKDVKISTIKVAFSLLNSGSKVKFETKKIDSCSSSFQ